MLSMLLTFMIAVATGLVAAGLSGTMWVMATGQKPQLEDLEVFGLATPLKVAVLILHAPIMLATRAWHWLDGLPIAGMIALGLACLWSFVQGVFILTHVFGVS